MSKNKGEKLIPVPVTLRLPPEVVTWIYDQDCTPAEAVKAAVLDAHLYDGAFPWAGTRKLINGKVCVL